MTALMPQSWMAQAACSREEPDPKLGAAINTTAFCRS